MHVGLPEEISPGHRCPLQPDDHPQHPEGVGLVHDAVVVGVAEEHGQDVDRPRRRILPAVDREGDGVGAGGGIGVRRVLHRRHPAVAEGPGPGSGVRREVGEPDRQGCDAQGGRGGERRVRPGGIEGARRGGEVQADDGPGGERQRLGGRLPVHGEGDGRPGRLAADDQPLIEGAGAAHHAVLVQGDLPADRPVDQGGDDRSGRGRGTAAGHGPVDLLWEGRHGRGREGEEEEQEEKADGLHLHHAPMAARVPFPVIYSQ